MGIPQYIIITWFSWAVIRQILIMRGHLTRDRAEYSDAVWLLSDVVDSSIIISILYWGGFFG